MKLEATLRQAGHDVTTVTDGGSLRAVLAARRYDFVLVDLPAADAVAREIEASGPELVPVAYKTTDQALRAAQRDHAVVIKAGKGFAYLAALDESMARRARTGASQ
jgi:DNA-binding response OmpR family regulator